MNASTSQQIKMIASLTVCKVKTPENQALRAKRIKIVREEIERLRSYAAKKPGYVQDEVNDQADLIEAALKAATGE